ncbi:MAG: C1 family peptidase [Flammeovirgaceae bacterium]
MKQLIVLLLMCCCLPALAQNTNEEYALGCVFDQAKYEEVPASAPLMTRDYTRLPARHSLKKYTPYPKSQGAQGSCTGWSTTYAARTIAYAIQNNITDRTRITEQAFSPSYVYNQVKISSDCSRGAYISDALGVLKNQGSAKLTDFPYECNRAIAYTDKTKAANFKITGYKRLSGYGNSILPIIKKSLAENKPVVFSLRCYASFSSAKESWNGVADNFRGYHAMTVIGYDDYKLGGAFEIQNSWGPYWGNGGYTWIKYSDFTQNLSEAYELIEEFKAAPAKPDLSGELALVKADGTRMNATLKNYSSKKQGIYRVTQPQYSGTNFRIQISNNEPAYVYLIGSDLTTKVDVIFPFNNKMSPALTYKSSNVAIPNEKYFIQMDDKKGTDYLCILYSKQALNIESIKSQIANSYGTFHERLNRVLSGKMVAKSDVKFEHNKIKFKATSKGKSVVAMVVEIDHR